MPDSVKYLILAIVLLWAATHFDDVKWLVDRFFTFLEAVTK